MPEEIIEQNEGIIDDSPVNIIDNDNGIISVDVEDDSNGEDVVFPPASQFEELSKPRLPVLKLNEHATLPTFGSQYAAGLDLYACIVDADGESSVWIPAGETAVIQTGIAIEIPDGYFGGVYARSGIATRQGLRPSNCVGVIDADYRGEILITLHNDSAESQNVYHGERIAQLIIQPFMKLFPKDVPELSDRDRKSVV
mgnify:CR=1 FL=1